MKRRLFLALGLATLFLVLMVAPACAKPSTFTVSYNRAMFRWRARFGVFGDWRDNTAPTQNTAASSDFTLTGNVLHTVLTIDVTPLPGTLQGTSTVYVYDAEEGVWINKEGTVEWVSSNAPYLPITQYNRGYLEFSGAPASSTFVHGVMYKWAYIYGYDEATVKGTYPNAVWDSTMGAWWISFVVVLWDKATQTYDIVAPYDNPAFPSPYCEPVPASNYNPMGL